MQAWLITLIGIGYLAGLFAVASHGDRLARRGVWRDGRPLIYALTLSVYCTSWTFFGSVGLAASSGLDFLTIYIGAGLMIGLGYPILLRIVRLAKAQNSTSIGDFLAARYGKNPRVAAAVALICVIGITPYIALQLKAVSVSVTTLAGYLDGADTAPGAPDVTLLVTLTLALFAVLFGTRHADATEHQEGLMLAIATEAVVKLAAFLAVGLFVTFFLFDGPSALYDAARADPAIPPLFAFEFDGGRWLTMMGLSVVCILLLPRQFHVGVVENTSEAEIRHAAWLFPLYLVAINLFVVPIAMAGLLILDADADPDMFMLLLPMAADNGAIMIIAFLGGLSAATAMVIVSCVALGIMTCNDLVLPAVLRRRDAGPAAMGRRVLLIRRLSIFVVLALAYAYYRLTAETTALAEIGLLSFAAMAQLAPAFFIGLVWRRGTANGAIAGMTAGLAMWAYTMLVPTFADAGLIPASVVTAGPFGIALLKPEALFGLVFDPLAHSVLWSLVVNIAVYCLVSLARKPNAIEQLQAQSFVPHASASTGFAPSRFMPLPIPQALRFGRSEVRVGALEATVSRYLGSARTRMAFERFAEDQGAPLDRRAPADGSTLRFAEHLLARAIGTASSRLVLSLLLERRDAPSTSAARLLDDASAAIQFNHDMLQSTLDHIQQGVCMLDGDLRLVGANDRFRGLLDLPPDLVEFGAPFGAVLDYLARRGDVGLGNPEAPLDAAMQRAIGEGQPIQVELAATGRHIDMRSNRMPDGGAVVTFTDVTDAVRAADALARANETLENRVRERTEELTRLNRELERARAHAEAANRDKTRFLAAASHDILQPLNAARLYVSSLATQELPTEGRRLAGHIDTSLEAVEDLLGAILDISRLDAGAMQPAYSRFEIDAELRHLDVEFRPLAEARGIDLTVLPCGLTVHSDRRLLRRLLQNLVGNAVKYTKHGRVLVGCRRRGAHLSIEVLDTGPGIAAHMQTLIFREFHRLERDRDSQSGLGLGLSIVDRIARMLDVPVDLDSRLDSGTRFSVLVPRADTQATGSARAMQANNVIPLSRPGVMLEDLVIVCIDNEAPIRDAMATLIGGWGAHVITAPDGKTALKAIRSSGHSPDVLIADFHLDRGDGLDTLRQLRSKLGDLPAILITADRAQRLRDLAEACGVDVLHKPVKPASLRALLARRRRPSSAPVTPAVRREAAE